MERFPEWNDTEQADKFFGLMHSLLGIVAVLRTIVQFGYGNFRQVAVSNASKGNLAVHLKHAAHEKHADIRVEQIFPFHSLLVH